MPEKNDQNASLEQTTREAFAAYNAGGPPDKANLTWDGKPVPPFEQTSESVRHKWSCATSTAAVAGAEYVIGLVKVGQHDPEKLRAAVAKVFGADPWPVIIRNSGLIVAGITGGVLRYVSADRGALFFYDADAAKAWWTEYVPTLPPLGEGSGKVEPAPSMVAEALIR